MKAYGNLINRISEDTLSPDPVVGMGVTVYWWSDRTAGTITKVGPSGKHIEITEDHVTEWRNAYGVSFAPNPNGRTFTARKTKRGTWKAGGNGVTLGHRSAYRDPHF